jgi:hypothetical protein
MHLQDLPPEMVCEVLWRLPDLRSIFALAATGRYMKQMVDQLRLRRVELPERRYKYEFVLAPENLSFIQQLLLESGPRTHVISFCRFCKTLIPVEIRAVGILHICPGKRDGWMINTNKHNIMYTGPLTHLYKPLPQSMLSLSHCSYPKPDVFPYDGFVPEKYPYQ